MSKRPPFARRRCHFLSPCKRKSPKSKWKCFSPLLRRLCPVLCRDADSQTASFSTLGPGRDPSLFLLVAGSWTVAVMVKKAITHISHPVKLQNKMQQPFLTNYQCVYTQHYSASFIYSFRRVILYFSNYLLMNILILFDFVMPGETSLNIRSNCEYTQVWPICAMSTICSRRNLTWPV